MTAASASPRLLLDQLASAGWGPLRGSEGSATRHVLTAIVRGSGARHVLIATANQVADRAGVSERHARRCLHALERLGLITWTRGHIERGRPRPGWFRLRVTALRQLIAHAREQAREKRATRADATRARLAGLRNDTLWPRKQQRPRHNPLSVHADMASTLPLREGQTPPTQGPASGPLTPPGDNMHACEHVPDINSCAICRRTLRERPDLDVRQLYRDDSGPVGPAPKGWRDRVRALQRQANHTQDGLL